MSRRVLVARLDNAGDVLLTGPAVRAIADSGDRVVLLCGPRGAAAGSLLPGVDQVVVHHAAWIDAEPEPVERPATMAFVERIAALEVDRAVISTSFHQSPLPLALLLRLAGVTEIGAISTDYPGSLLDVRHRVDEDIHEAERSLSLVRAMGYGEPADGRTLRVAVPPGTRLPPELERLGRRPYVVVHPGASVPARAWPPDRHRTLVGLLSRAGWSVVVTGGGDEVSLTAWVAGGAAPDGGPVLDLGGRTDLASLSEVLRRAVAVVVGNTGPAHLAAAVGRPVVSLYAPTVPAVRWRPWSVPHVLLGSQDLPCAGCRSRRCPRPGHPCLGSVTPEDVIGALVALGTEVPSPVGATRGALS